MEFRITVIAWAFLIWAEMFILIPAMKILVNALCAGVLRHEEIQRSGNRGGNPVYYVGRYRRDGLGGASFASGN